MCRTADLTDDVTHLHAELEDRLRFETFISELSARFMKLSSSRVDEEIEHALQQVTEFFKVTVVG